MAKPKRKRVKATRPTAIKPKAARPARPRKSSPRTAPAKPKAKPRPARPAPRPAPSKRAKPTPAKARPVVKQPATRKPARPAPLPAPVAKRRPAAPVTPARPRPPAPSSRRPAPRPAAPIKRKPGAPAPAPRKRKPSRHPEAVRSRNRRALAQALRAIELEKAAAAAARRKEQRAAKRAGLKKAPPDERQLAIGWLEAVRNDVARVFDCSLEITEAGGGHAELEGSSAALASRTPWLVVGRFDPQDEIGYAQLAVALQVVADDVLLEAQIHPQRLSQIRVTYSDPNAKRGEGDSVVSKIGAWEFILGDMIGELVGSDPDDPDEGTLAERYDASTVPHFYIFFSAQVTNYVSAAPWAKTHTVKLR